jgi:outer membrane protein assembly factor BamA
VIGASPLDAGVVTLSPGDPVLASRLAEARQALTARLASRGLAHAVVTTRLTPDFAHATATVVFEAGRS